MKTISSPTKVTGMEAIDTSKPYVYAVNHASALDIPVLYVYLPFEFRIAFKKELLAYPIVGWHLKRSGQICVDQQNPSRSIGSIRAALKSLKSGMPLVIFPEGGRTPDGEIKPFLPGALFLAIKAQVDIVPVALGGNLRIAADEYLPHQVPAAGNAGGAAHFDLWIHFAKYGRAFGSGAPGGGGFVQSRLITCDLYKTRSQFSDLSCQWSYCGIDGLHPKFFHFFRDGVFQIINPFAGHGGDGK